MCGPDNCREDRHAGIVVAGVDDIRHRVADPIRRFELQFIKHQNLRVQHRCQNGRFDACVRGL